MRLDRRDLEWARDRGLLTSAQLDDLWTAMAERQRERPHFTGSHVAMYAGALVVIAAMGWFLTEAWERFGGAGICVTALAYVGTSTAVGRRLWTTGRRIPGGLLATIAVSLVPLAIYGFERWTGLWPGVDPGHYYSFHVWIRSGWFVMEVGAVVAGLAMLRLVPFGFVTAPIAFALWYMSMDAAPLLFGPSPGWETRQWVSIAFGAAMIGTAIVVEGRRRNDLAFWLHLFGLCALCGGMALLQNDGETGKLLYAAVHAGLVALSVPLDRRAYTVFGGLGVFGYLGHLAHRVFRDSLVFPVVLSGLGIGIMLLGMRWDAWVAARRRAAA